MLRHAREDLGTRLLRRLHPCRQWGFPAGGRQGRPETGGETVLHGYRQLVYRLD
jgi:hypothetical protein